MKFSRSVRVGPSKTVSAAAASSYRGSAGRLFSACLVLCGLVGSTALFSRSKLPSQPATSPAAKPTGTPLTDAQMAKMSSDELAHYVFENHGCTGCHTLGANGKLGFTDRGKEVGKGFEGCIAQLTAMSNIVKLKESDRTEDQKHKVARFQEFGCTTCHQLTPGKLGLTTYGTKLKSLHMACTDVENDLSTQKR
jgi:cytochrome c551/c552